MLEKIIRWIIAFVLALLGIEYNPRPDEGPKESVAMVSVSQERPGSVGHRPMPGPVRGHPAAGAENA